MKKGIVLLFVSWILIVPFFFLKEITISEYLQFFLGMLLLLFSLFYSQRHSIRFSRNKKDWVFIFILSILYNLFYFCIGFIVGFQKSPYEHHFFHLFKYCLLLGISSFGVEYLRSLWIIKNKNHPLRIIGITLFLLLLTFPYPSFLTVLSNYERCFQYCCSTLIPFFLYHLFTTYLVLKTNSLIAIPFCFLEKISVLFFPILPSSNWFMTGSLKLLKYLLFYSVFQSSLEKEILSFPKKEKSSFLFIPYAFVLVFATLFTGFMLGFFPYKPIAILTNSMYPTYERGDVVILKELTPKEKQTLKKNTIIIYKEANQFIAHRIIKVIQNEDQILYQTKGDFNQTPDFYKVKPNQIKGIYSFHFKYFGFPSIWLHEALKRKSKIEMK